MPVSVNVNTPEPVTPPPTTYDIIGLSYEQAAMIRDLLGRLSHGTSHEMSLVYNALLDNLPGYGSDYQFVANSGNGGADHQIYNIKANPLG
jgi:hypothetical protein